jgi:hypothetical protein
MSRGQLRRALARSSPAGLAAVAGRGTWSLTPHLKLLNNHLLDFTTAVEAGQSPRLRIAMPPRHGKSKITSETYPAWVSGRHPDWRCILTSYEADFAATWGRKARDLVEQYGDRYFGIHVRSDSKAADRWDLEGHDGGMSTAGVNGPITGKGAHVLIIDDPVKDAKDANSETFRRRSQDWYRSTAYTRLEPGGGVILIQTRWHEEDLSGYVAKLADETGERWTTLCLPALAEEGDPLGRRPGDPLWPDRYGLDDLLRIRKTLGSYWWSALYQQRPQPAEGGTFKRSWLKTFEMDGELFYIDSA